MPEFAETLERRISNSECVVCGASLRARPGGRDGLGRKLEQAEKDLRRRELALSAASETRDEAERSYNAALTEHEELATVASDLRARIAGLIRKLPPDEQALRSQSDQVSSLRARLDALSRELTERRGEFEISVHRDMATIARKRKPVVERFQSFAEGFLFESSRLRWAPHKTRVGQTGPLVDFPSFEVEMTGSDFPTPVRRSAPDEVSESQREFIDLAFRMTLLAVAGDNGVGSIVIDAPETSLDAVFAARAAQVLSRFGDPQQGNRLVITSNLVDGELIPELISHAGIASPRSTRVVDLLEIATPTGAIRALASQYRAVRKRIFAKATQR